MTLTNKEIRESIPALNILQGRKFPVREAYKLKRNLKTLQTIAKDVEETRQELLKEYAKTDDDGEIVKATDTNDNEVAVFNRDNREIFEEEYEKLLEVENEVTIHTIDIETLEDKGIELEAGLLVEFIFVLEE